MNRSPSLTGPTLRLTPIFFSGIVMRFSIYRVDDSTLVGILVMVLVNEDAQIASLELLISNPEKRKQYGPEAIQLALQYVFGVCRYTRLTVRVPEYDGATISLIEQTGFILESRQQQVIFLRGRFWDDLLYSMMQSDWQVSLHCESLNLPVERVC